MFLSLDCLNAEWLQSSDPEPSLPPFSAFLDSSPSAALVLGQPPREHRDQGITGLQVATYMESIANEALRLL